MEVKVVEDLDSPRMSGRTMRAAEEVVNYVMKNKGESVIVITRNKQDCAYIRALVSLGFNKFGFIWYYSYDEEGLLILDKRLDPDHEEGRIYFVGQKECEKLFPDRMIPVCIKEG